MQHNSKTMLLNYKYCMNHNMYVICILLYYYITIHINIFAIPKLCLYYNYSYVKYFS